MAGPAVVMREIHRLRKFARDLQEQLDRIPRQIKAQQARVTQAESALKDGQEAVKKLKLSVHEKEVALKATDTKLKKRRQQLEEALTAAAPGREIDGLRKEVDHEQAAILQFEDEILAAIGEGEERIAAVPALEQAVKKAKDDYAAFEMTIGERRDGFTAQLNDALAKLREAEKSVPSEVRGQYNRMVAAMGPDALAAVQGHNCTSCYTEITVQSLHDLQRDALIMCKSCGRILYLPVE